MINSQDSGAKCRDRQIFLHNGKLQTCRGRLLIEIQQVVLNEIELQYRDKPLRIALLTDFDLLDS